MWGLFIILWYFFSPASQLVELKYWCILQVTQCGKHLRNVIHLLKEQNTLLSQKRKRKKRGWGGRGLIQFELLHTFCVIQDNFENNYLFQTQNLHSSDFCSFSLHEFPLQIQLCSLNWFIENINNISYNKKWSIQKKKNNSAFVLYLEQKCNKLN